MAIEDIIPLDAFFSNKPNIETETIIIKIILSCSLIYINFLNLGFFLKLYLDF